MTTDICTLCGSAGHRPAECPWRSSAAQQNLGVVRRIVCAANRARFTGEVVIGIRHYDAFMRKQMASCEAFNQGDPVDQGFIDQHGVFLTREEAFIVATEAMQIIRRVGGDEGKLFSENLY